MSIKIRQRAGGFATWTVDTYQHLLYLNKIFLEGEEDSTPYHVGALVDEELKHDLICLTEYGLLTHDGQAAERAQSCMQRAYVSFFIQDNEETRHFMRLLFRREDIILKYRLNDEKACSNYDRLLDGDCEWLSKEVNEDGEWEQSLNNCDEQELIESVMGWNNSNADFWSVTVAFRQPGREELEKLLLQIIQQQTMIVKESFAEVKKQKIVYE